MAEAGQFSDLASREAGSGQNHIQASLGLSPPPTGIGDLHRAGVGSPRVSRPGDGRGHAGYHKTFSEPHSRQTTGMSVLMIWKRTFLQSSHSTRCILEATYDRTSRYEWMSISYS